MSKVFEEISSDLADWLGQQHMFVVATAPLSAHGLVNCSPKGMDAFRVLGPLEVGYLDLTGSGVETIAHLRENGRMVVMFTAFKGPPRIVRMHGRGEAILVGSPRYAELAGKFPDIPGARAIIRLEVSRVSDSCGYSVPLYEYAGDRDTLVKWAAAKGPEGVAAYQRERNARSLDGLPGCDAASEEADVGE
jgi:hypothetical protein